jgi:hypothetical protein
MLWLATENAYQPDLEGTPFLTPKDFEKVEYSFLTT